MYLYRGAMLRFPDCLTSGKILFYGQGRLSIEFMTFPRFASRDRAYPRQSRGDWNFIFESTTFINCRSLRFLFLGPKIPASQPSLVRSDLLNLGTSSSEPRSLELFFTSNGRNWPKINDVTWGYLTVFLGVFSPRNTGFWGPPRRGNNMKQPPKPHEDH